VDFLIGVLGEGGAGAEAAAEALGAARPPALRQAPILRAFDEAEPGVRARLAAALAASGDAAALTRLGRAIGDQREVMGVRAAMEQRSEERRVGKECRSRWS